MPACPKCGYVQQEMLECSRCGIVFSKYRRPLQPAQFRRHEVEIPISKPGLLRRSYRIFRWAALALSIVAVMLVMRRTPPPQVPTTAADRERARVKVEEFSRAARKGAPARIQLNDAELNGWVESNMALKGRPQAADIAGSVIPTAATPAPATAENVSDIRIGLADDTIRAWVMFDLRGIEMTLELEGILSVQNGYIRLRPTSGRLGSLPLSQAMLDKAVQGLFESPQNREKFRLPDGIADIEVRNSKLTILSQ